MNDLENHFWTKRQTILEHINKLLDLNLIKKEWFWKSVTYKINVWFEKMIVLI